MGGMVLAGTRWALCKTDRNSRHPCSTFPVNTRETGTNNNGNTRVYTGTIEPVYRMGINNYLRRCGNNDGRQISYLLHPSKRYTEWRKQKPSREVPGDFGERSFKPPMRSLLRFVWVGVVSRYP